MSDVVNIDLVLFYDIVHDNIDVNIVDPNVTHTRGHSLRIIKQQCRINARLNSFACRNVNAWNSLPENVVWCQSRATFKRFINILDFSKKFLLMLMLVRGCIRDIYGLSLPLISSHCSFCFFFTLLILLFAAGY